MNGLTNWILSTVAIIALYVGVPSVMVWGCVRWIRRTQARTVSSVLSLLGLVFATASALLVVSAILYARSIPGYGFSSPDPPALIVIIRSGVGFSLAATVTAVGGAWRPNLLRWHSLIAALGTLFFWFAAGMGR
jgi:hypothetical protein